MSLPSAWRIARREMRGGLRGFRIFLACLALGVAAIAAVGSVRSSIEAGLAREGAALLGGDAAIELTYRFANAAELKWMEDAADQVSEIVDFRSMAVVDRDGQTEHALTQIKAVDDAYPLTGTVKLSPDMSLAQALAGRDGMPGAVMAPALTGRLGLQPGDRFRLGTQDYVLSAILEHEPDGAASGFALGPRTIVTTPSLQGSGLLAPGTLYSTHYRLDLPPGTELEAAETEARQALKGSGMRWSDARNGAPGIAEFVERLGAFLILVGLSGLTVGGVGVSAAVRAYLSAKTPTIATLRSLGADRATVFQTYLIQIGLLSALGIAIGVTLGGGIPLALAPILEAQLPIPAEIGIYPEPLIEAAVYGILTALIFTLWPLARTEQVRAATLFRDALSSSRFWPAPRFVAMTAVALGLVVLVAGWFSGSFELTLWTLGGIAGAMLLLVVAAMIIRALSRASRHAVRGRAPLRWALAAIGNPREGSASVVLSLGLGLSVLASVGQIDGNLRAAISGNLPDVAPSYFFVDIQKNQMPGFLERLNSDPAVSRVDSAPMMRGVVARINGRPASEVAGDHWVVQGDRGLTYAATKPDNARIVAGEWWSADHTGAPQISFAREEAEEMGLKLGDEITVNILGRDITTTITSFREVDFSSAGMGFVLTINPAAVAGAPHSFIATVYAEAEAEEAILRDLAQSFPNITAIRVREAIDRVSVILEGLAAATSYGAAATLLTGFLVLIGAAAAGEGSRTYESAILKTLGADRRRILWSLALRSGILGLAAGAVALLAGIAGGWAVCYFVFDMSFAVMWPSAIGIITGGALASLLASLAFAWRPLAARPSRVLRARE